LVASGYRAKVFEFISTEHTSKNLMITATKRFPASEAHTARALAQHYGIRQQRLAERLGISLAE